MTLPNINKPQTIFPDLPRNEPIVDANGMLNNYWRLWLENLVLALQTNLKNEGFVIPQLSTSDINLLTAPQSVANIIYDSTVTAFKGNLAGTWKTFTLT